MDTNRKLLKTCIAAMVLLAGSVSAQTIYKQVDDEGRVMFTDQPNPSARTVTSFEAARPRAQPSPDAADDASRATREPARRFGALAPSSPGDESAPRPGSEAAPRVATVDAPSAAAAPTRGRGDVERAVFTYAALNTSLAAQVDATEAARRVRRQAMPKDSGSGVLVMQAAPRDHDSKVGKGAIDWYYLIWAATFILLAAGLLYVGWLTFRLILGRAFPEWELDELDFA